MKQATPVVGDLLRTRRHRAGLTQRELAGRAQVSIRTVRNIERNRITRPRPESVQRLAHALALPAPERDLVLRLAAPQAARPDRHGPLIGVLGSLSIELDGEPIDVGSQKIRCLLGLLAIQPTEPVSRDEIVDMLWGDRPPKSCLGLVHTYVARLRALLRTARPGDRPALISSPTQGGYRLDLTAGQLDLARFDDLVGRAARMPAAADAVQPLLAEALRCWRGPVLADLDPRLRQHPAAVAAARRRQSAALAYADAAIGRGRYDDAVGQLAAVAEDEPLHEGLHARLVVALAGAGQQAVAMRTFHDIRRRLATELGVQPGAELHSAYLDMLRPRPPATVSTVPVDLVATPAQLPAEAIAFTGRRGDLRRLDESLADGLRDPAHPVVIVAIAGSAGVGKTALAVRWAYRVRDRFPDGQLYVDLRGYAPGPPARPVQALAGFLQALGVPAKHIPADEDTAAGLYRSVLADRRLLVVLDNARDAAQVRPLLPGSAGCLALVTSRDRLTGLAAHDGAHRVTLDVLAFDEARALLAQLVGDARVSAEPDAAAELVRACARLPLALRIAAANLTNHPDRSIGGYLAELQADSPLVALHADDDDQAAVRAAFDVSYRRLRAPARRLFRLIGLFPGPEITAGAAAALAGTTPAQAGMLLDRLAAGHLIGEPVRGRYILHDLLRRYAIERGVAEDKQSASAAALQRLFDWYLYAVDAAAQLTYPEPLRLPVPHPPATIRATRFDGPATAMAWLDTERANLVAAVSHATAHGYHRSAWLIADAMRYYFILRMNAVDWVTVARCGLAAAEAEEEPRAQAMALLSLADSHLLRSRYAPAIASYERALALARDTGWLHCQAAVLGNLGSAHRMSGRPAKAIDCYRRSLALDEQTGRLIGQATNVTNIGNVYREQGRLAQAAGYQIRAIELYQQAGARLGRSNALANLAEVYAELGQVDRALCHLTDALAIQREVGDRRREADSLATIAAVHRDAGRIRPGIEFGRASLRLARDTGDSQAEIDALNVLGTICHELGFDSDAIEYHEQALQRARGAGQRYPETDALLGLAAAAHLDGTEQARAWAEEASAVARRCGYRVLHGHALSRLAAIQLTLGDPRAAADLARRAAEVHRDAGHHLGHDRALRILGYAMAAAYEPVAQR